MGTYDTRGGTPISPDESDYMPSDLVEKVLGLLEDADVATEVNDKIVELIELGELQAFDAVDTLENQAHALRAENERLRACLLAIGAADDDTTAEAFKSVANDAVMNLITSSIAEHQLVRRSKPVQ